MLIQVPRFTLERVLTLLKLLSNPVMIDMTVHLCRDPIMERVTPTISIQSYEAEVHGLTTMAEVEDICRKDVFQPLTLTTYYGDSYTTVKVDFLRHTVVQKGDGPLSLDLLKNHGLYSKEAVEKFTQEYE